MIELREITPEEYHENLRIELHNTSLLESVKMRCDEINDICGCMRYVPHRYVQELLVEIMDLVKEGS